MKYFMIPSLNRLLSFGRRGRLPYLLPTLYCLLILGCGGKQEVRETKEEEGLPKAPAFVLVDLDGKEVKLFDFKKKKVVILNFWATWCAPCRKEIPDFVELYDQYGKKGFEMVGISLDQGGPEVVKSFAEKYEVNYTLLMDDGKAQKEYGPIDAIPTTFILDKNHRIYKKYRGFRPKEVFEKDIRTLLGLEG